MIIDRLAAQVWITVLKYFQNKIAQKLLHNIENAHIWLHWRVDKFYL